MSLLLTGSKTITIAGTEMQCLEIYTGESYTLPFQFTDTNSNPINCVGWTVNTAAKWYTCSVSYTNPTTINITNLTLNSPQPSGAASANIVASFTDDTLGEGYLYLPADITGGTNGTPVVSLTATLATLVIITMGVSRTDALSSSTNYNREPFGILVRYQ